MKKNITSLITIAGFILGLNSCNYDKPLKRDLLKIWNEDQDIRNEATEAWKKTGNENPTYDSLNKIMYYLDSIHLVKVIKTLDEKGWIGKDKIGSYLQKPESLTTSGRQNRDYHIKFKNKHLAPDLDGQLTPAKGGQGNGFSNFYLNTMIINSEL